MKVTLSWVLPLPIVTTLTYAYHSWYRRSTIFSKISLTRFFTSFSEFELSKNFHTGQYQTTEIWHFFDARLILMTLGSQNDKKNFQIGLLEPELWIFEKFWLFEKNLLLFVRAFFCLGVNIGCRDEFWVLKSELKYKMIQQLLDSNLNNLRSRHILKNFGILQLSYATGGGGLVV